eukprot:gene16616-19739_t
MVRQLHDSFGSFPGVGREYSGKEAGSRPGSAGKLRASVSRSAVHTDFPAKLSPDLSLDLLDGQAPSSGRRKAYDPLRERGAHSPQLQQELLGTQVTYYNPHKKPESVPAPYIPGESSDFFPPPVTLTSEHLPASNIEGSLYREMAPGMVASPAAAAAVMRLMRMSGARRAGFTSCRVLADETYLLTATCTGYHPYGTFRERTTCTVAVDCVHPVALSMVPIKVGVTITVYELVDSECEWWRLNDAMDNGIESFAVNLIHSNGSKEEGFRALPVGTSSRMINLRVIASPTDEQQLRDDMSDNAQASEMSFGGQLKGQLRGGYEGHELLEAEKSLVWNNDMYDDLNHATPDFKLDKEWADLEQR